MIVPREVHLLYGEALLPQFPFAKQKAAEIDGLHPSASNDIHLGLHWEFHDWK